MALTIYKTEIIKKTILLFLLFCSFQNLFAQTFNAKIIGYNGKVYLSKLSGEKTSLVDSNTTDKTGNCIFDLPSKNLNPGIYRFLFDRNNQSLQSQAKIGWIDFVNEGKDVTITTNVINVLDSLRVIKSESNQLFYSFLKLNKLYKIKSELLNVILTRYPKEDAYHNETRKRLNEIQTEYLTFVNVTAQKEPTSFVAKYIQSSQLPVIDSFLPFDKQLDYLKSHSLDYINFNDAQLINSDLYTNKTIEYLTYFRNSQLPKELLEKEFMSAVDSILNKAKVNQLVYQHITEYLIDGFKKFGFDKVLDYIVENYVIKDDLCLDVKTEGLIKRRIEQAQKYKPGKVVPNIVLPDISGKQIDMSKITSEKILIVFYASWCPHCKELLPMLNELKRMQSNDKLEVLAISLDNKKEEWTNFVNVNCTLLTNVSDLHGWDGHASSDYFIYATPTMFLLDKERKLLEKPLSYDEVKKMIE